MDYILGYAYANCLLTEINKQLFIYSSDETKTSLVTWFHSIVI